MGWCAVNGDGPGEHAPDPGEAATVADVAEARGGVRPESAVERFDVPGWGYEGPAPVRCPRCAGQLHALRRLYDGPEQKPDGQPSYLVAVICPACPRTFTLRDLRQRSYVALMGREPSSTDTVQVPGNVNAGRTSSAGRPAAAAWMGWWHDCDLPPPGELSIREISAPADQVYEVAAELLGGHGRQHSRSGPAESPLPAVVDERCLLHWCKITDPHAEVPVCPAGTNVRVILPLGQEFD